MCELLTHREGWSLSLRAEWLQGRRRLALTVHVLLYSCSRDTSLKFLSAAEVAGRRQDNSTAWGPRVILCVLPRDVIGTRRRRMLYTQHVHPPHFECDDYVITRGVRGIVHALVHGQGFGFGPCQVVSWDDLGDKQRSLQRWRTCMQTSRKTASNHLNVSLRPFPGEGR